MYSYQRLEKIEREEFKMKRSAIIVMVIILCFIFAQTALPRDANKKKRAKRTRAGVKGGGGITKILDLNGECRAAFTRSFALGAAPVAYSSPGSEPDSLDFESRQVLAGGFFLTSDLTDALGIELDMLFTRKGAVEKFYDLKLTIDYIEFPLLFKFYIKPIKASLVVGPYYAFRLTRKDYILKIEQESLPTAKEIKTHDWGFTLGVNIQFKHFIIEPRYSLGMAKMFKGGNAAASTLYLLLGYEF
jgi:hypothetical protein